MNDIYHLPYHSAVVSYVDILGFREMIAQSVNDRIWNPYIKATLEDVQGVMGTTEFGEHKIDNASKLMTYAFSDLVVRTVAIPEDDQISIVALNEIIHLALIQFDRVANLPLLLRGSVCSGKIVAENRYVFGPALIRAYDLERQLAIYPRIVVDTSTAKAVLAGNSIASDFLRQDLDGVWFIDYLFGSFMHRLEANEHPLSDEISRHRDKIINALCGDGELGESEGRNERIRQKFVWLGSYHNAAVHRMLEVLRVRSREPWRKNIASAFNRRVFGERLCRDLSDESWWIRYLTVPAEFLDLSIDLEMMREYRSKFFCG